MSISNQNSPTSSLPTTGIQLGGQPDPQQQWLQAVLKLRSELKFDTRTERGTTFVVIEDTVRSKYFQIGVAEFEFIASIDGVRSTADIVAELHENGHDSIGTEQAVKICQWLMQSNLIISELMDPTARLKTQVGSLKNQALLSKINPISFKINLFNPNNLLSAAQPWFDWLFSKPFFLLWLTAAIWAIQIAATQWTKLAAASQGVLSGTSWISLLVFWLLLKVIHEFAHGIACKRYGGEVPEAGVLMLLFTPMAFVNVTSMWRFPSRWQRIIVAAAGMYVELFVSFIALIVWANTTGLSADTAYNVFLMASVTTILFNANPLMRFDGYFILSDLVNVPNLYTKGTGWFGDRVKHLFLGTEKTHNLFAPHESRVVKTYGSMAFFWKISISVGLVIAASVMFNGAGLILGALGVVLWFGLPMMKQYKLHFTNDSKKPINRSHALVSCVSLGLLAVAMFWVLKGPATKSAPALVQFAQETILRSSADGFVDEILVESGQNVVQGQPLLRLRNEDLTLEVTQLQDKIKSTAIQQRIYRQENELALASVESVKLAGLKKQLIEKREQADGLIVRSPLKGFIFARNLHHQLGSFVKQGDELMTVAKRDTKEIVVSVDQRDLESIQLSQHQPLRIALPGIGLFESKIARIDPRASNSPTHPTLCANAGGPLPMKPAPHGTTADPDQNMVLLSPRFDVLVSLDEATSESLRSGQRGKSLLLRSDAIAGQLSFSGDQRLAAFENRASHNQRSVNAAYRAREPYLQWLRKVEAPYET